MTEQPPSIRAARDDDLGALCSLLRTCDLPYDDLTPEHLAHFLVVPADDGLRGCIGLEPRGDDALLRSLAVRPTARGEGLGGRLLAAVEQRARRAELRTFYLLTTTAAPFFRDRGYTRVDRETLPDTLRRTEEVARLCPASATCMRKRLDHAASISPS